MNNKLLIILIFAVFVVVACGEIEKMSDLKITSPEFEQNQDIPSKFTCQGENVNPELNIDGIPENTISLVLIMDDPDIPNEIKQSRGIEKFDHWVVFNMPKTTLKIEENSVVGTQGKNSAGDNKYTGPCPPSEFEPRKHRYFFKLYALDANLELEDSSNKEDVEKAMEGHIIVKSELIGLYEKS